MRLPLKIAYITVVHSLHDHRFLYKQCGGLAEKGYQIDYYVQHEREENINGVNIKPINVPTNRVLRFIKSFALFGKIWGKYDAVHLVDPELLPLGILIKMSSRTKVVFDAHEDYVNFMYYKHYLPRWIRGVFSVLMKGLIRISGFVLDGFVFADIKTADDYKIKEEKKVFFYNFPCKTLFTDSIKNWDERTYELVFLGSMSRTSGIFVVLESIVKLKKQFTDIKALFIGRPGDEIKKQVQRFIEVNKITSNIHFTGRIAHGNVPELLQDCKIGLIALLNIPKFHKNIATKTFEYMASGIPVVSADLPPERRFLVENETAKFFKPGDADALAKCAGDILSNNQLGIQMQKNCLDTMNKQNYYTENQVDNLAAFYDELLNQESRR